jgi:hypothetical protein
MELEPHGPPVKTCSNPVMAGYCTVVIDQSQGGTASPIEKKKKKKKKKVSALGQICLSCLIVRVSAWCVTVV